MRNSKLSDWMQFVVNCVKSHHRVISEALPLTVFDRSIGSCGTMHLGNSVKIHIGPVGPHSLFLGLFVFMSWLTRAFDYVMF